MPARKAPAKKAARKSAKKAAKGAAKKAVRTAKKAFAGARKAAKKAVAAVKKKAATRRPPGAPPVQKTRVVIAMDVYEPQKDAIKAPFKEHELKWNFLGEGKGLYKRADNGVHCFTQFKDDGVHYSIWGSDQARVGAILASWRALLGEAGWAKATASGEQAVAAEKRQEVSEALRLWALAQPQRRPGEPDLFYEKRVAEWQAKKPA